MTETQPNPRKKHMISEPRKFVAFRVDSGTGDKIEYLEELKNKSKTDVIIDAIDTSYNKLLLEDALGKIVPMIREVFPNFEVEDFSPGSHTCSELDEKNIKIPTDEVDLVLNLNIRSGGCKIPRRKREFDLNLLFLEIRVEGHKTLKIEVEVPVISQPLSKIETTLLKTIFDVASRNGLEVRTKNYTKTFSTTDYRIETTMRQEPEWKLSFKKKLKSLQNALNEVLENISPMQANHSVINDKEEPDVRT